MTVNPGTFYGNAGTNMFSFPLLILMGKHEPWERWSNFRTLSSHRLVKPGAEVGRVETAGNQVIGDIVLLLVRAFPEVRHIFEYFIYMGIKFPLLRLNLFE